MIKSALLAARLKVGPFPLLCKCLIPAKYGSADPHGDRVFLWYRIGSRARAKGSQCLKYLLTVHGRFAFPDTVNAQELGDGHWLHAANLVQSRVMHYDERWYALLSRCFAPPLAEVFA